MSSNPSFRALEILTKLGGKFDSFEISYAKNTLSKQEVYYSVKLVLPDREHRGDSFIVFTYSQLEANSLIIQFGKVRNTTRESSWNFDTLWNYTVKGLLGKGLDSETFKLVNNVLGKD